MQSKTGLNRDKRRKRQSNRDGDGNLKGPSVTPPIMIMCIKDKKKEGSETSEKLESHMFGGEPKRPVVIV